MINTPCNTDLLDFGTNTGTFQSGTYVIHNKTKEIWKIETIGSSLGPLVLNLRTNSARIINPHSRHKYAPYTPTALEIILFAWHAP